MQITNRSPLYVQLGFKFLVLFFICFFIWVAQDILVPFAFAVLLAVLLLPLVNFLESKNVPRVLSIAVSLFLAVIFISTIIYFLSTQIANFVDDIPSIKKHLNEHWVTLQKWIRAKLHISLREQNEYFNDAAEKIKGNGSDYISDTFFSITEAVMLIILLPIYTFLILYYRDLIRKFLYAVFRKEYSDKVALVIKQSKLMINSYMTGLLIEMGIVAACNSIGLAMLGIKYALFFGVLAAVLNIIPYIGMFTATLFTVLVTLTTSSNTSDIVWVIVIMYGIHILDVNILMPKIIASRLRINALISILGVIAGGALTGISGLFLSVPAVAMIKIICDQVEGLQAWGLLLGDDITGTKRLRIYDRIKVLKMKKGNKPLKPPVSNQA
ncbi:MAG TPA: AI-2E family transporter [Chitinophagaceae bacterium]|nr:AI-2E family transporter [Chitinophagaceae bacterium]